MTEEFITLSHQELDRLCIIQAAIAKKHSQQRAAMRLGISTRQVKRFVRHAHTPQAKGRVERANQTLQDRLVKELRLRNISNMEQANEFLSTFIQDYNRYFGVAPQHSLNAHRKVLHSSEELANIFCLHHIRKLSKNLSFQSSESRLIPDGAKGTFLNGLKGGISALG